MTADPLPAHSLAEAYLYLMATPCPHCRAGPLAGENARPVTHDDPVQLVIPVCCGRCGERGDYTFAVPGEISRLKAEQTGAALVRINPTDSPSKILDVAQWIMLFRVITEAAAKEADKIEARRLGCEAAQCLDEALKFYEEDNDLPPDDALFHDASRALRRDRPDEFSRERLIGLRAKLPTLDAMEACQQRRRKRKPWWAFWR